MDEAFDPMSLYEQPDLTGLELPSKDFFDDLFFQEFLSDEGQKQSLFEGLLEQIPEIPLEQKDDELAIDTTFLEEPIKDNPVVEKVKQEDDEPYEEEEEEGHQPRKSNKRKKSAKEQVDRRRELNRKNARKSRLRQKFKVESLILRVARLEQENKSLRDVCKVAEASGISKANNPVVKKILQESDYSLMKSLTRSASTFCISDPNQTDNPIVYASKGFLKMTGYDSQEVIGKNCRFLQGPGTKPETISKIREGLAKNEDVAVTLLNYRKDGSTFWNQLFIAPLMGKDGNVVHYVGVQREITVKSIPYSVLKLVNINREKSKKLAKGTTVIAKMEQNGVEFRGFDGSDDIALVQNDSK